MNKLKGIFTAQTMNIKFEDYCNCLFRGEYQKACDSYKICSISLGMYLQKAPKTILSAFGEKRWCTYKIETTLWN